MMGRCGARAIAAALICFAPLAVGGQVAPDEPWRTLGTDHFRVHFPAGLEEPARRAARSAEKFYGLLATELVAPRQPIDLIISDNADFANGYTTMFPTNRVYVYLHPPVQTIALRTYSDWIDLVVAHELLHVFHLDRTRGLWRLAQHLFGRNPLLFPNAYAPTWLVEGLAVYYETRLTGSGRLEGTHHDLVARTAGMAGELPRLSDLNRGSSRFPGGDMPYVYGSLLFEHLARSRGPESVREFIEGSSGALPLLLGRSVRKAFGMTFERAFRELRDSIARNAPRDRPPMPGWRDLTLSGRYAFLPRWRGDRSIDFAANTGRETPGAYTVDLDGRVQRVARLNNLDASNRLADGSTLFAQQDFLDLYHLRSDLYIRHGTVEQRLTRGARLSHPDVRDDGEIVAMQALPLTTRIVRVSADGKRISPVTAAGSGTFDEQWTSPRWSHDGARIVAARHTSDRWDIVVFDSTGSLQRVVAGGAAVYASPAWSANDDRIYFTSDRDGALQAYVVPSAGGEIQRVSEAVTGLFEIEPSPDGDLLAGNLYRADGFHIGVAPRPPELSAARDSLGHLRAGYCPQCRLQKLPLSNADTASVRISGVTRYSPWRSLLPRYWFPLVFSETGGGTSLGGFTHGFDLVGRHAFGAQALVNTRNGEADLDVQYTYAGLGQPVLTTGLGQDWSHSTVFDNAGTVIGDLGERSRAASVRATIVRKRVRSISSLTLGAEIEQLRYRTDPDTLQPHLAAPFREGLDHPLVFLSASWNNVQYPGLAISGEDGVALSGLLQQRWQRGASRTSAARAIVVGAAYKSLDLPGFAHHVLAFRGAVGVEGSQSTSLLSAGGVSGASVSTVPGYVLGEGQRTFAVRGYPAGAERGTRAYAFAAEYRVPLAAPARRLPFIPLFVDRVSASGFVEGGRAYCPSGMGATPCGSVSPTTPVLTSIGAELILETPAQVQAPYRLRAGLAHPLRARGTFGANSVTGYVTFGQAF